MENKKKIILIIFYVAHYCSGQFFYTNYQEADHWLMTNDSIHLHSDSDTTNIWSNYKIRKNIRYGNAHHFGIFFNAINNSSLNLIQEKSDLIGNGLLTNYRFLLSNLEITNSMFFTYDKNEAARGFVRTIKNITMYTNQAYLKFTSSKKNGGFMFKIGRDFLIEGDGNDSKIFFSDYSRPFDQLSIKANYKQIHGRFAAISLDSLSNYNRYLYMHTLEYISKKLKLRFGEAVISSGFNESIDIKLLNPFNLWSWENLGSSNRGLNAFLYSGFSWMPKSGLRIYGELLIDDINFHKENAFFLNKYAFLLGFQKTSFPLNSSNMWFEYSSVLNQVYQSFHPSHIYTHRSFPIGHYLGNDFQNYRFHYSQIFKSKISKAFIDISYLIKGSNSLKTPFDNPWEDSGGNFINSYRHPGFPTPPLSLSFNLNLGVEIELRKLTYMIITIENQKYSNSNIKSQISLRFWSYLEIKK